MLPEHMILLFVNCFQKKNFFHMWPLQSAKFWVVKHVRLH